MRRFFSNVIRKDAMATSRISDDSGYICSKNNINANVNKYTMTRFAELENVATKIYPGVPNKLIDTETVLKSTVVTKCKSRNNYQINLENLMPHTVLVDRVDNGTYQTKTRSVGCSFTDRTFQIFTQDIPSINVTKAAIGDSDFVIGGVSARFD